MIIWEVRFYDDNGIDGPIVTSWCPTRGVAVKERRRLVAETHLKLSDIYINKHDISSEGGNKNLVCRAMALPKPSNDRAQLS